MANSKSKKMTAARRAQAAAVRKDARRSAYVAMVQTAVEIGVGRQVNSARERSHGVSRLLETPELRRAADTASDFEAMVEVGVYVGEKISQATRAVTEARRKKAAKKSAAKAAAKAAKAAAEATEAQSAAATYSAGALSMAQADMLRAKAAYEAALATMRAEAEVK